MIAAGRRTGRLGWSEEEMKLECCLGDDLLCRCCGRAGRLLQGGGSIIMVWLGSQGEGGAGGGMDCAV